MGVKDVSQLGGHALHTVHMAGTQPLRGIQPQHAAAFGLRRREAERKAREEAVQRRQARAAKEAAARRAAEARDAVVVSKVDHERRRGKAAEKEAQEVAWERARAQGKWALHEACRRGDLEANRGTPPAASIPDLEPSFYR